MPVNCHEIVVSKLHDNSLSVVCFLQGSHRALYIMLISYVEFYIPLVCDVVPSKHWKFILAIWHLTAALMMQWTLSKVMDVGCTLDMYLQGYQR